MKKAITQALKAALRRVVGAIYRVDVRGLEHFERAGERVLVVANHTSFLDAALLYLFLPDKLTFAVNTYISRRPLFRPFLALARIFPMDPSHPLSMKSLVRFMEQDRKAVIFPEGRITVTGSLMKIYDGPGLVADKSGATVLPVRIDGAQYTPFSRMRGRVRLRWFPKITLTILPGRKLAPPKEVRGRARRKAAGRMLSELMTETVFETSNYRRTLFDALLDARRIHGGNHHVIEDTERRPASYNRLIAASFALGTQLARATKPGERVGLLLPSANATLMTFMGLQAYGRVPAMLNFTVGAKGMRSACQTATLRTVITSRRFVEAGKLEETVAQLGQQVRIIYLEDLAGSISIAARLKAALTARFTARAAYHRHCPQCSPDDPAVVLFTSGSEGAPKGVVLSHANLLANREQLATRVDFSAQDVILNALPLFHSFGLTAGTLLPVLSGMKTFFYPSPLHYRIIPEIAYDINATVLFGTNTFLSGYARVAHPYDFYSVRYVFAGAEKLHEDTRRLWSEKFGVRIFEGYGATETSPVLAANTPTQSAPGTVGRFLPGVEHQLEPVPGVAEGGRLYVKGPNVMLGYLLADNPGQLVPPTANPGAGWYDTGDIVSIDEQGFVSIRGRAKRFAKVGGEMISLMAVEELATRTWPNARHAAVTVPDGQKGEQVVLLTEHSEAQRAELIAQARQEQVGEITVPKRIVVTNCLPLLGTGKTDYPTAQAFVAEELAA